MKPNNFEIEANRDFTRLINASRSYPFIPKIMFFVNFRLLLQLCICYRSSVEKFLKYQLKIIHLNSHDCSVLSSTDINKGKFSTDHSLRESSTALQFKYIIFTVVFFATQWILYTGVTHFVFFYPTKVGFRRMLVLQITAILMS